MFFHGISPRRYPRTAQSVAGFFRPSFRTLALGFTLLSSLLSASLTQAASPEPVLVKNLRTMPSQTGLDPQNQVVAGNRVFMIGTDEAHGEELWISDGTEAGTRLVKDIQPGYRSSEIYQLTASGSRVFFRARDGVHGNELWVSDGTEAGTRMVLDLAPESGDASGAGIAIREMAPCGEGVVFIRTYRSDNQTPTELWYSDGTEVGTRKLHSVYTFSTYVKPPAIQGGPDGAWIFLRTTDSPPPAVSQQELLRVDAAGTSVTKIAELPLNFGVWMQGMLNGKLIFSMNREVSPSISYHELWRSDGTAAGTFKVKQIAPLAGIVDDRQRMVVVNGKGYLRPMAWVTDGTEFGTQPLSSTLDFSEGAPSVIHALAPHGSREVVISASVSTLGIMTWVCDPQTRATRRIFSQQAMNPLEYISQIVSVGSRLVMLSSTEYNRGSLWLSDGTAAGTVRPSTAWTPHNAGSSNGSASLFMTSPGIEQDTHPLVVLGQQALFMGENFGDRAGRELWKSDGTPAGTAVVKDTVQQDGHSRPLEMVTLAGKLYFIADDGVVGRELWCSDGSAAGTVRLSNININGGSEPRELTEMNGTVYFTASDGVNKRGLWRTNGTPESTLLLANAINGVNASEPEELTVFKNRLYFSATGSGGRELWVTDGTVAGTQRFADFNGTSSSSNPTSLTVTPAGDWLLFIAPANGRRSVCYTDGTPGNLTSVTHPLNTSIPSTNAKYLISIAVRPPTPGATVEPDKQVVYVSENSAIWRFCIGEPAVLIREVPSSYSPFAAWKIHLLTGGNLLLSNADIMAFSKLPVYRSDGTAAGTTAWGNEAVIISHVSDEHVYFQKDSSTLRAGLFRARLDGSSPETLISNISSSNPSSGEVKVLHAEGDQVFFARGDGNPKAYHLWQIPNGQSAARRISDSLRLPVSQIYDFPAILGVSGSGKYLAARLGNRLYFTGNAGPLGEELYALDLGGMLEVQGLSSTQVETGELISGTGQDFGFTLQGRGLSRRYRLRNTGSLPLTDIALSVTATGSSPSTDLSVTSGDITSLAPGATADITVIFDPKRGGTHTGTLQISATGTAAITHTLTFTGTAMGIDEAPQIIASPAHRLALAGQPLTLAADFLTAAPWTSAVWKRDAVTVAETLLYERPAAALTDAGVYTLTATTAAGTVTTSPAVIGILLPALESVTVNEGAALTLTCTGKAPKDHTLQYQWRRNGEPLTDSTLRKGSLSATLKITRTDAAEAGQYDCLVTLAQGNNPLLNDETPVSLSAGLTNVVIMPRPRILPPEEPLSWMIGQQVSYQIATDLPATAITAKGLPPGLKMSKTGLITGKPTRSLTSDVNGIFQPYQVTFTATNAIGPGPATVVPVLIRQFFTPGNYDALVDRMELLQATKGSHVKFSITTTGALSGQLLHRGKTHRFTSSQVVIQHDSAPTASASATEVFGSVTFTRGSILPPIVLSFVRSQGMDCVDLYEGDTPGLWITQVRRHCFSAKSPATGYIGNYTLTLTPEAAEDVPEGTGYLSLSVAKTGVATWKGKLPDGTALTGSNALSAHDIGAPVCVPVHQDLYKLTGALHGTVDLPAAPEVSQVEMAALGQMEWSKDFQPNLKERNYRNGIPFTLVNVRGTFYKAPAKGERLLDVADSDGNARVTVTGHIVSETPLTQTFTLTSANKAVLVKTDVPVKTLTFTAATGLFKGSLLIPHPTDAKLNRTATFEGILTRSPEEDGTGAGFFLLPELPAEGQPASSLKTTPLRSGKIEITPVPAAAP